MNRSVALLASVTGAMMVAIDGTALLIAQPNMLRDLNASVVEVQWTSTAYLVAVASLLILGGRLGDRFGHARLLLIGAGGFGAASVAIVLAPGIDGVIAGRAVQGLFGALLQPATLALLRLAFPADRLSMPVAIRTSGIGVAAALGPVLGGALVDQYGWRSVFIINVPVALLIVAAAVSVGGLEGPRQPVRVRLPLLESALTATSIGLLVHALTAVPLTGWAVPTTLFPLSGAAVLAVLMVSHQRRAVDALVPAAVARSRPVMASMCLLLVVAAALFGSLFVASLTIQDGQRLSALAGGLQVLPLTAAMVLGAPLVGLALRRWDARRIAVTGVILVAAAVAGLARFGPVAATTGLLGAGYAIVMVTATGTVVGDAPPVYAGVVGGLKQTALNLGSTVGIAIAAAIMTGWSIDAALWVLCATVLLALVPAALLTRPLLVDSVGGRGGNGLEGPVGAGGR
ncbi:MFS transporter [Actinoplanes sichuanensis]|uniref:MFS transporter n=1 Tax=Actinoplanes sichuanensis TaxID=512349 RepID=A0ABW4A157_9ACTN|nr:MFS transporter [Actinoplanes sichuanensis]BEL04159.1 MFS transporter [Actinoplanes sichuanensis]